MKELGDDGAALPWRDAARRSQENGFDMLLVWGEMAEYYARGRARAGYDADRIRHFENKGELVALSEDHRDENDVDPGEGIAVDEDGRGGGRPDRKRGMRCFIILYCR